MRPVGTAQPWIVGGDTIGGIAREPVTGAEPATTIEEPVWPPYGAGTITIGFELALVKLAAAREGRPKSEYFHEAFHPGAVRTRRWDDAWDIPVLDYGRAVTAEEIDSAVRDGIADSGSDVG